MKYDTLYAHQMHNSIIPDKIKIMFPIHVEHHYIGLCHGKYGTEQLMSISLWVSRKVRRGPLDVYVGIRGIQGNDLPSIGS